MAAAALRTRPLAGGETELLRARVARLLLWLAALALCSTTVLALSWAALGENSEGNACIRGSALVTSSVQEIGLLGLSTVLLVPLAFWLTAVATSSHLRQVAAYVLWNWASGVLNIFSQLGHCRTSFYGAEDPVAFDNWVTSVNVFVTIIVIIAGVDLAVSRVESVEMHSLRDFGSRRMRNMIRVAFALTPVLTAMMLLQRQYGVKAAGLVFLCVCTVTNSMWFACVVLLYRALFRILRSASGAAANAPPSVARSAGKVPVALRREMLCLTASFLSSVLSLVVGSLNVFLEKPPTLRALQSVMYPLDQLCNAFLALLLTGALSGAVQGASARAVLAMQRHQRRRKAVAQWLGRPTRTEELRSWDDKVAELAGRGVSLAALLRFFRELPEHMPHFDPERHTTADVVRQRIIPMTSSEQCSGAEAMMQGEKRRPDKMVTHAWSNLFRDLIAAIAADACAEGEFALFSKLLVEDMDELERWVHQAGVGGRTYWICAFSVNQHRSVCHKNGDRVDSVTGKACPACGCGLAKAWNDTAPTLPDGRSVPCEMNKFDDMIRFLAACNPCFAQVVPIDRGFATFTRAWCIAELAAANELGMVQDVKIRSGRDLEKHSKLLHGLRIQDMQASRQEDKEAILAAIPDHDAFDASVQRLLFEDLLPSWSSLDALERMACAGRFIRWHDTVAWAERSWEEALSAASPSEAKV